MAPWFPMCSREGVIGWWFREDVSDNSTASHLRTPSKDFGRLYESSRPVFELRSSFNHFLPLPFLIVCHYKSEDSCMPGQPSAPISPRSVLSLLQHRRSKLHFEGHFPDALVRKSAQPPLSPLSLYPRWEPDAWDGCLGACGGTRSIARKSWRKQTTPTALSLRSKHVETNCACLSWSPDTKPGAFLIFLLWATGILLCMDT